MPMEGQQKDRSHSSKFRVTPIKRTVTGLISLEDLAALKMCDGTLSSQIVSKPNFIQRFGESNLAPMRSLWTEINVHAPSFHPMLAMS